MVLPFTQILLILGMMVFIGIILFMIKKHLLSVKYAIIWLVAGAVLFVFAAFPYVVLLIRFYVGVEVASNLVFMIVLSFLVFIVLGLSSTVSCFAEQIKRLTQSIAILEKRTRELEDKNEKGK